MARIFLIRHGETEWNVGKVFRGRKDVALNEQGLEQAELLGRYLQETKLDAVHSSPLKRALVTAKGFPSCKRSYLEVHGRCPGVSQSCQQGLNLCFAEPRECEFLEC